MEKASAEKEGRKQVNKSKGVASSEFLNDN
jgi:hypothetical protein